MSKDKKKLPNPVGKKGLSDYQLNKSTDSKIEMVSVNKKSK
jgi:hypothetical protein